MSLRSSTFKKVLPPLHRIIRVAETYTAIDIRYFASGSFWLFTGYAIQTLTGIAVAVLFANTLPKEVYGIYQFILSMVAVVSIFTLTGMGASIIQAVARGNDGAFRFGVRTQLLWSTGITISSLVLSIYYALHHNYLLASAFVVVGILQPFVIAFGLSKWYLQGRSLFRVSTVLESIQRTVLFVTLVIGVSFTQNPVVLVTILLVTQSLSSFVGYLYVVRRYRLLIDIDKSVISYGAHLSVMESLAEAASVADKVLVWFFLGAAPLAAYALALMPVTHLQAVFGFVRMLAFPKLVRKPLPELLARLPRIIGLYTLVAFAIVAVYIISAPFIFSILFPLYSESVIYSQILALSVLAVPRTLISQTFTAHSRTRELYILNVSTPVLRITLLAIGLAFWGVWGAVMAILTTELYGAAMQIFLFARVRKELLKSA